jgi:hypothetical protein
MTPQEHAEWAVHREAKGRLAMATMEASMLAADGKTWPWATSEARQATCFTVASTERVKDLAAVDRVALEATR